MPCRTTASERGREGGATQNESFVTKRFRRDKKREAMFLSRGRNVSKKRRFRSVLAAPPPPCAGDCSISLSCFSGRLTRFLPSANNQVPRGGGGGGKDGGGGRQWPHNSLPFVPHRRPRPAVAPKASFTSCEVGGPSGSLPTSGEAGRTTAATGGASPVGAPIWRELGGVPRNPGPESVERPAPVCRKPPTGGSIY